MIWRPYAKPLLLQRGCSDAGDPAIGDNHFLIAYSYEVLLVVG